MASFGPRLYTDKNLSRKYSIIFTRIIYLAYVTVNNTTRHDATYHRLSLNSSCLFHHRCAISNKVMSIRYHLCHVTCASASMSPFSSYSSTNTQDDRLRLLLDYSYLSRFQWESNFLFIILTLFTFSRDELSTVLLTLIDDKVSSILTLFFSVCCCFLLIACLCRVWVHVLS